MGDFPGIRTGPEATHSLVGCQKVGREEDRRVRKIVARRTSRSGARRIQGIRKARRQDAAEASGGTAAAEFKQVFAAPGTGLACQWR